MKKSNKLSLLYVLSSLSLFLVLVAGGVYGIYVSVGLSFVRSSVAGIGEVGEISNVSYGGTASFSSSMSGVIILSIVLVVIAVFDFISLIKQITFFKQFNVVKNSNLEKKIEKKVKSKSSVIFWAFVLDIVSFIVGVIGIVINNRSVVGARNVTWILYLIDALVSVLSLISFVLLIAKLKSKNNAKSINKNRKSDAIADDYSKIENGNTNINEIEYNLTRLLVLKNNKMITDEEFKKLRKKVISSANILNKNKID